eukprot:Lithocolla_globosa_v1_NODE_6364_length_1097_cov_49.337812.p1 type:complete len:288 gc:universal NODE_6364_length_1097_cov_49.337812:1027-164(-)
MALSHRLLVSRAALAGTTCLVVVISYVICLIIVAATDTYTGGLKFPYFSDTGRDPPGYYVFAILNSIAGCTVIAFAFLQHIYMKHWFETIDFPKWKILSLISTAFLFISGVSVPLLSIFSTSDYPDLHSYSSYAFFICMVFHGFISTYIYFILTKHSDIHVFLMKPRYASLTTLFIGVVIYLPVGLLLVCDWERLSYSECLEIQDADYCEEHRFETSNSTDLWKYSTCSEVNTMRSVSQFICILSLMVFVGLYTFDPFPNQVKDDPRPELAETSKLSSAQNEHELEE